MISLEEAITHILNRISRLGKERLHILQVQGRVLAEDIYAPRNIPPWDNSAMDGYALRWEDIQKTSASNPSILKVLGDLPAGKIFHGRVRPGEAVRIMTGAPLPGDTDTVIPVEYTEKIVDGVKISASFERGSHIRRAGEDVKAGEKVLGEGIVLRPPHIGMLASIQRSIISVYQQPRVAILSTGDELLDLDEPWEEGKIINSNGYSLASQVAECGGVPLLLGIAKDHPEDLSSKIQQGLNADLLITSGGVSMGDYDFVKRVLQKLGEMNLWKVAMRPGQPLAFGMISGKPLFGLPGNPVSSMVSFEQFARPSILKMSGHPYLFRPVIKAVLQEDLPKKEGLVYFIRCRLKKEGEKISASTTGEQGSGILSSMVKAHGLIILPREATLVRNGEEVQVLLFETNFLNTLSR
jgi:molybdopterin molybdotransferase